MYNRIRTAAQVVGRFLDLDEKKPSVAERIYMAAGIIAALSVIMMTLFLSIKLGKWTMFALSVLVLCFFVFVIVDSMKAVATRLREESQSHHNGR